MDDVGAIVESLDGSIVIGSLKGSSKLKIPEMIVGILYCCNRVIGVLDGSKATVGS